MYIGQPAIMSLQKLEFYEREIPVGLIILFFVLVIALWIYYRRKK